MAWSAPSWSPRARAAALVAVLVAASAGVYVLAVADRALAAPSAAFVAQENGTARFTLYGSVAGGWGNGTGGTTNPGPTLYVYAGQNVSLALYSEDGVPHTWFIDFNNDRLSNAGEPDSGTFRSASVPFYYNFTVNATWTGDWTYRCGFHPTSMTGRIVILTPSSFDLYGSVAPAGWGYNASSITEPGPTLVFLKGTNATFHLFSADGVDHTWFLDYSGNAAPDAGEPQSKAFNGTAPTTFSVTLDRPGTWTYRCGIHPNQMSGTVLVIATGTAVAPSGFSIGLVPGLMLATIVVVLLLAGVYQVRAVRAHRKQSK